MKFIPRLGLQAGAQPVIRPRAAAATRCSRAAGFFGKFAAGLSERAVEEHWREPLRCGLKFVPMEARGGCGLFSSSDMGSG